MLNLHNVTFFYIFLAISIHLFNIVYLYKNKLLLSINISGILLTLINVVSYFSNVSMFPYIFFSMLSTVAISSYTYSVLYKNEEDINQKEAVKNFNLGIGSIIFVIFLYFLFILRNNILPKRLQKTPSPIYKTPRPRNIISPSYYKPSRTYVQDKSNY